MGTPPGRRAVEQPRPRDFFGPRQGQLAGVAFLNRAEDAGGVALDAREEGGELPKLLPLPRRERVVVALGAFQFHAEEQPGRAGRQVFGL